MRNEDRLNLNPLGKDPALLAQQMEPERGYTGNTHRLYAPSPAAAKLMEECVNHAYYWRNSYELSAAHRWKRERAIEKVREINRSLRDLNIRLMREYLSCLRGEKKMRAYRTIANLEAQQT